jgi:hypothetical protein
MQLGKVFREVALAEASWVVPNVAIPAASAKENLHELWESVWKFQLQHVEDVQRSKAKARALPVVMFTRSVGDVASAKYQLWEWVERPTTLLKPEVECFGDVVVAARVSPSNGPTQAPAQDPGATPTGAGQARTAQGSDRQSSQRPRERERRRRRDKPADVHVRLRPRFLFRPETHVVVNHPNPILHIVMLSTVVLAAVFALLLVTQAITGFSEVLGQILNWVSNFFSGINSPVPSFS